MVTFRLACVVCRDSPYSWTRALLKEYLPRFGVSTTFVDSRDVANIERAIQDNTTLLYLESPNSLTFELQDIRYGCRTGSPEE